MFTRSHRYDNFAHLFVYRLQAKFRFDLLLAEEKISFVIISNKSAALPHKWHGAIYRAGVFVTYIEVYDTDIGFIFPSFKWMYAKICRLAKQELNYINDKVTALYQVGEPFLYIKNGLWPQRYNVSSNCVRIYVIHNKCKYKIAFRYKQKRLYRFCFVIYEMGGSITWQQVGKYIVNADDVIITNIPKYNRDIYHFLQVQCF